MSKSIQTLVGLPTDEELIEAQVIADQAVDFLDESWIDAWDIVDELQLNVLQLLHQGQQ